MNYDRSRRGGHPAGPRGVLLLLVLISLTLFLLLGVALLVNATRLRMAARSFSTASDQLEAYNDRAALDEALLVLLRGSQNALPPQISESILADRYGADADLITTAVPSLAGWPNSPVLTATVAGANARHNGRVLTLAPVRPGDGDVVSFRVIGAGAGQIHLSNVPGRPGLTLPTGTCRWLVNGRDFAGSFPANEPWDGFTTGSAVGGGAMSDPWLARVEVNFTSGTITAVQQATYQPAGGQLLCDNDGDGVADGVWIDGATGFLPPRPSPRGGIISNRVSYLVLDLDGRLNINAAGIPAYPTASPLLTGSAPLGMGYGPADIDVSALVPATTWTGMVSGGSSSISAGGRRRSPGIGTFSGRYGPNGVPGAAGDDAGPLQIATTGTYPTLISGSNAVADLKGRSRMYMQGVLITGSPTALMPTLTWSLPQSDADSLNDPYEFRLDAGAPRLGGNVWSGTAAAANDDMPYTVAELERVLRVNDPDAPVLTQRLAAALGTTADAARLRITTDSWDTPAVTGSAARLIEDALAGPPNVNKPWIPAPPEYSATAWTGANALSGTNAWSPDVAAGLRFNINRPVLSGTSVDAVSQRQEYCKGLYTLVRMLGETDARRAAQWAVNVLDFRDEDSAMTRFVYDSDLSDGWSVTGTTTGTVWGVERPEMLIVDTAAWRNQTTNSNRAMFVSVIRAPYPAVQVASGGTTSVEQVHAAMRIETNLNTNATAVGSDHGVWQLRLDGSQAAAFRPLASSVPEEQWFVDGTQVSKRTLSLQSLQDPPATDSPGLLSDGLAATEKDSSCVISSTTSLQGMCLGNQKVSPHVRIASQFRLAETSTSGTVMLERLADPTRAHDSSNPYIVVDMAPVSVVTNSGTNPRTGITSRLRRPGPRDVGTGLPSLAAFWRQPSESAAWQADSGASRIGTTGTVLFQLYFHSAGMFRSSTPGTFTSSGTSDPVPWFHWPNRPFVSNAELALVPADDANGMLRNYSFPTTSLANGPIGQRILDATIVPSRFAGSTVTVTGTTGTTADRLRDLGMNLLVAGSGTEAGQISTWREPGKMNVNTMPTGITVGDQLLWPMLVGGSQTVATGSNPFTASGTVVPTPARSLRQMMSLSGATDDQPPLIESIPPFIVNGTATSTPSGTLNPRGKNPFLAISAANRLANMATIRSNVFAVWITVETTDSSPGAPPPVTRRLFAIIDRSLPVGYKKGEDLNVRDTIRLLRQLD